MNKPFSNLQKKTTIMISCCVLLLFILFSIFLLSKNYVYLLITAITVLYLLLVYLGFEHLYTRLNLEKKISSYFILFLNITILLSYIINMLFIFIKIPPIYLKDITMLAQYRYLMLVLLSILFGSLFLISCYNTTLKSMLTKARFPYLKEEIKIILEARFKNYLEPKCSALFNALVNPKKRLIYLCIHFFVTCITRIIILGYFINFTFFNGNLVSLRYFLFLSFFLWIFSFVLYYFDFFCTCTIHYVNTILKVSLKKNLLNDPLPANKSFIISEDLTFEITSEGLKAGFANPKDITFLIDIWYKANNVNNSLIHYKKYTSFINMIIFSLYFTCWCSIIFYHKESLNLMHCGWFSLITGSRPMTHFVTPLCDSVLALKFTRNYTPGPTSNVFWVHAQYEESISKQTDAAFKHHHAVYGTVTSCGNFFIIEGSITHGLSDEKNPSTFLTLEGVSPNDKGPTRIIPFKHPLKIPIKLLLTYPIEGSNIFMRRHLSSFNRIHSKTIIGKILDWSQLPTPEID